MAAAARVRQQPLLRRRPDLAIRTKLTVASTALVAVAGLATVGVVSAFMRTIPNYGLPDMIAVQGSPQTAAAPAGLGGQVGDAAESTGLTLRSTSDILNTTLIVSVLAVLLVVAAAAFFAWLIAGRMLRPLKAINAAAQQASAGALNHRIDLTGPRDELRDLADTFDAMLERLDRSFATAQRFAANASHELRTPLATTQTMLDVALADPTLDAADLRAVAERVLETNRRGIAIVAALLELAEHDDRSIELQDLDLVTLVESAMRENQTAIEAAAITVTVDLPASVPVRGDRVLLRQAVLNLVNNAVRHNQPGGTLQISSQHDDRTTALTVENTGEELTDQAVSTLTEPFVRGSGRIAGTADRGHGLGLAIVDSIIHLHGGSLTLRARTGGGLVATTTLPRCADAAR